jgi:hypothetical protein
VTPRKRGRPQKREYLTPAQAAAWLADHGRPKVCSRTVSRACDSGKIRCVKTPGGYRRILITDLEDYLRTMLDTPDSGV